jgi:hypothetical protein
MQIDIDFDVFKALTALRQSEADSYNAVLRRVLLIPAEDLITSDRDNSDSPNWKGDGKFIGTGARAIAAASGGIWFGNVFFEAGTKFRATYKGQMYCATVRDGKWIGEDGIVRRSPSDAACAISRTNVNGWRFWHALRPGDNEWVRLDSLRS